MSGGILDSFQTIIPTAAAVLSERRQMLRMTQQEVADQANITLRQYQRLESGERNILTSSFGSGCATSSFIIAGSAVGITVSSVSVLFTVETVAFFALLFALFLVLLFVLVFLLIFASNLQHTSCGLQ